MCYEYFSRDPSTWGIIDFLNQCDLEPFERKIDHYIKSLDEIVTSDQASRREAHRGFLIVIRREVKSFFIWYRRQKSGVTGGLLGRQPFKAVRRATKLVLAHR